MSGMKEQDCIPRHHTYGQRLQSIIIGRMIWNGNALSGVGWNTLTGSMVKWSWAMQARTRVHRCVTNMLCYGWHRLNRQWRFCTTMETSRVEVFPVENMTTRNFLEVGMNSRAGQQTNRPKQRQTIHWEQNQRSDPTGLEYKHSRHLRPPSELWYTSCNTL